MMMKRLGVLLLLALLLLPGAARAQSSDTSQLVTWLCTGSPCPWGNSLTGQALVWPTSMQAVTTRLGYTMSDRIYLPVDTAAGMTITVTTGTATISAGLPDATSHQVFATLSAGQSFLFTDDIEIAAGAVISVQSQDVFSYELNMPHITSVIVVPSVPPFSLDVLSPTITLSNQFMPLWNPADDNGKLFPILALFILLLAFIPLLKGASK
jgi:hypothetical protein